MISEYNQIEFPQILYDEAEKHLQDILNWFKEEPDVYNNDQNACAECLFTQSLVAYKLRKQSEAIDGMSQALNDYYNNLGIYDRKTQEVERVMHQIQEQQQQMQY